MWRHGIYVIWTLFERVQSTILGDADANCNYKFAVSCFIFSRISLFCGYAGLDSKGSNRGSVSNGSHGNHSPDAPPPLDPSITYINAGEEDQMVGSCCAVWWRFSHFHIPSRICFPSDWPLLTRQSAIPLFLFFFFSWTTGNLRIPSIDDEIHCDILDHRDDDWHIAPGLSLVSRMVPQLHSLKVLAWVGGKSAGRGK